MSVAVDILDEDHSLGLAMRRLSQDEPLRRRLGANARAWWSARHTLAHMVEDYMAAIDLASATPAVPAGRDRLPAHSIDVADATLKGILGEFGVKDAASVFDSPSGPAGRGGPRRD